MRECYINCFKNEEVVLQVKVPWWNADKLEEEYDFDAVKLGGELDFHLTVTGEQLREIHESHLPSLDNKVYVSQFVSSSINNGSFIRGQIDAIIKSAFLYDKVKIVLWYVIQMDYY